jgi:lysophospholipase L1-like esterase
LNIAELFRSVRKKAEEKSPGKAEGSKESVEILIDSAVSLALRGEIDEAVKTFKEVRTRVVEDDPSQVEAAISRERATLDRESYAFEQKAKILSAQGPEHKVVIISDSLGLPRGAADSQTEAHKLELTYSGLTLQALSKSGTASVQPLCRRYATTEFMLEALEERADCEGAHVLIHIGLNDCAVRMFKEEQRLALSTLPEDLRLKIVRFSTTYRVPIIESDFEHTYTPLALYRNRLSKVVRSARSKGAKSVTLTTIIQPPMKFVPRTPQMAWNFNRYNMAVYDAAKDERCNLIDIDRLTWENDTKIMLSPDGMHLSAAGHALVSRTLVSLIA